MLRHLAANNVVLAAADADTYTQTPYTLALREEFNTAWIKYLYDALLPAFTLLPDYLRRTAHIEPHDTHATVFIAAKGSPPGEDLFTYYAARPSERRTFEAMLGGAMAGRASWLNVYGAHAELVADHHADDGHAVLVDIGSSVGHDALAFCAAHPTAAQRVVLQDRPEVLAHVVCGAPAQLMPHDFFTPQPVVGARVYYMRGVLHDWDDGAAGCILARTREAMAPDSRLLVHEHILPDGGVPRTDATGYDLTMIVMVGGRERGLADWRALLAKAKLAIVKVWHSDGAPQSIIETMAAENDVSVQSPSIVQG